MYNPILIMYMYIYDTFSSSQYRLTALLYISIFSLLFLALFLF